MDENKKECYFVHRGNAYLLEENDKIYWAQYMVDATMYDTQEDADTAISKYGLSMCATGWRSSRKFYNILDLLPPREQRIIPGVIGHPTGGKIYDLLDVLYAVADEYEKNFPKPA